MPSYSKRICWDSCIWIAWLTNEKRHNHEMDGVYECVEQVESGKILLFSSAIIYTEVLQMGPSQETQRKLDLIQSRRNVRIEPIDVRVGALSIGIKTYYRRLHREDGRGKLTENDATHLATAIHFAADAFYTFDNGQQGSSRSLLSLNGNVHSLTEGDRVHPLLICKPPITQARLFQ